MLDGLRDTVGVEVGVPVAEAVSVFEGVRDVEPLWEGEWLLVAVLVKEELGLGDKGESEGVREKLGVVETLSDTLAL